jgi:glycerophosphodiester phosphodiesterase
MLNMKQPNYPVFFLTEGGTYQTSDIRCNSLQEAIRFAKFSDLLGIVTVSDPLLEAPNLCKVVKQNGLILFTYGQLNNDVRNVEIQREYGVDAVIVDRVVPIARFTSSAQ